MALTCNIDARGRKARLLSGCVSLVLAVVVTALWAWPTGSALAWGVAIAIFCAAAFTIFEALAGWCALRAMGIKTKI